MNKAVNTVVVPSVVGVGQTDMGLLSLGQFSRGRKKEQPYVVTWNGASYLVGPYVHRFARPVERMDFQRLSDGVELRALTYATLGLLLGSGEHTIHIVAGLPVDVMMDENLAKSTRRGLRSWLVGEHRFELDGEEYAFHVPSHKDVQVMAQPAGSYFTWGLDDSGQWKRSPHDLEIQVAICDIGFNTLDAFTIREGRPEARYTDGDTVGMRRAAEMFTRSLRDQYGVKISLHEADQLLRQKTPRMDVAEGEIDLQPMIEQALTSTAGEIIAFLESRWGQGKQFAHLLFTGGGSAMLHESLKPQFPFGTLVANPVTANALGLARYARRVFDGNITIGMDAGFGGFKAARL
jgi:plasmid segregation protein ParM